MDFKTLGSQAAANLLGEVSKALIRVLSLSRYHPISHLEQFSNDCRKLLRITIAILKNLAPVFQPFRSKTNPNRTLYARFFPHFTQVPVN